MLFDLITLGLSALDKIPSGKGKRKQAVKYQREEIKALALLRGDLEAAANSGETIGGFALKMLVSRLGLTQNIMEVTANAIDDDTPEN